MDLVYNDIISQVATYNRQICVERKQRLPFIDAQTGVAQVPGHTHFTKQDRMPGRLSTQVYSYPEKRWKRRRREKPLASTVHCGASELEPTAIDTESISAIQGGLDLPNHRQIDENSQQSYATSERDKDWYGYDDEDDIYSLVDADDGDDADSDFEDSLRSKSRRRKTGRKSKSSRASELRAGGSTGGSRSGTPSSIVGSADKSAMSIEDGDRTYACHVCGNRYKTTSGLRYHYTHVHDDYEGSSTLDGFPLSVGDSQQSVEPSRISSAGRPSSRSLATSTTGSSQGQDSPASFGRSSSGKRSAASLNRLEGSGGGVNREEPAETEETVAPYCDFCLGDENCNKHTGVPEQLVSCADCGRCGHPSCLKFTRNMLLSSKKYPWQCIECKSCWLCGTQDNDDQLLFCDDCDRGYHLYCLTPPLSAPPEGNWSCSLCVLEYHTPHSSNSQSSSSAVVSTSNISQASSLASVSSGPGQLPMPTISAPSQPVPSLHPAFQQPPTSQVIRQSLASSLQTDPLNIARPVMAQNFPPPQHQSSVVSSGYGMNQQTFQGSMHIQVAQQTQPANGQPDTNASSQ